MGVCEHGGRATNQSGALKTIARQPSGEGLLILMAIGLAGYAIWRITRALLGHGPEDTDSGFERLAAFASGVAYTLICAARREWKRIHPVMWVVTTAFVLYFLVPLLQQHYSFFGGHLG